jgi:hypothetical protein
MILFAFFLPICLRQLSFAFVSLPKDPGRQTKPELTACTNNQSNLLRLTLCNANIVKCCTRRFDLSQIEVTVIIYDDLWRKKEKTRCCAAVKVILYGAILGGS